MAQDTCRIVLDEDLPAALSQHLRARGLDAISMHELKQVLEPGSISDDEVCEEVARIPSVLVTLNVRDYADQAFIARLAERYRVSVVIVRPPKAESGQKQRPAAIHDIVHRQAPKISRLHKGDPEIVSANRASFRRRNLDEIVETFR